MLTEALARAVVTGWLVRLSREQEEGKEEEQG